MSVDRLRDCTACANLRTHPNPTQPFHAWMCATIGLCVGPTVLNCSAFKARVGGECPPKADTRARPTLEAERAVA